MLFEITELGKHVAVYGFNGKPRNIDDALRSVSEKFPDVCVQFVDLDKVAGSRCLLVATYNALKSFNSKHPISKSLGMEILLYASGSRQIVESLERAGVNSKTERIAVIAVGSSADDVTAIEAYLADVMGRKSVDTLLDEWSNTRIQNVRTVLDIRDDELNATLRQEEEPIRGIERLAIERSALLAAKK
ncbi:MAG TPA: KEOPS complex subunit Cgi121 [Candidatus Acidoferrales bacterium]|nr:KEOPS complex subunit Cgi121 [Candidatus Acidoferrales bacterium]